MDNILFVLALSLIFNISGGQIQDEQVPLSQTPNIIEQHKDNQLGLMISSSKHGIIYSDNINNYIHINEISDFNIYKSLNNQKVRITYSGKDNLGVAVLTNGNYSKTYRIKSDEVIELKTGKNIIKLCQLLNESSNRVKVKGTVEIYKSDLDKDTYIGESYNIELNQNSSKDIYELANKLWGESKSLEDYVFKCFQNSCMIKYDHQLAQDLTIGNSDYRKSDINETLRTQKGICLDIASYLTSLIRAKGIEARLVFGQLKYSDEYHAWVECYLPNKGWIIIDPTSKRFNLDKSSIIYYDYVE